jgi:hypothetical protein
VCFCGWDVGTGDINEFWKEKPGIERCMGTQKLPNITSISIRRPPTHEQAARATFFPYGFGDPEQLFSPTVRMHMYPQNTMKNIKFDDSFRYLLDPFRGAVLGSVCCLCKGQLSA